ncbi:hypothetical protein RhiirA5_382142 [Rhizophagus irregularis]|uniref:Uncharacterized protein n=1 Tax=Rhizophagus irregularis TaxID=588596 RepID=A0A2N0P247_9GLOM|nr:hypothetical protein RhiirA5_382142 [Rhizophagus irregularis]
MNTDKSRKQFKQTLDYVSGYNKLFHYNVKELLGSFIQDSFLKDLFIKNPSQLVDKGQLLIRKFGEAANSENFTLQAQAINIQPTTLSLIFFIALYVSSRSWNTFAIKYYMTFGDMGEIYESFENGLDTSNNQSQNRITNTKSSR